MDNGNKRRKYLAAFLMIWVVQMVTAFYFCVQKQGFHEDEYYTYYSTARTNGFYVEDGQWMDRDTYRNEFVVLPGQGFQYGLVKLVQSWDVHPPMYYWVFHTVASLAPGVFSKWIGLSVNLVLWGVNVALLAYLAYRVSGRKQNLALLVMLFYGLSPAAMSGVVFIRMYEMLTTFVLLCATVHVQAAEHLASGKWKNLPVFRCLVPMAAVTYLGLLTQYYYFIFLFYLAVAFGVWMLWRERKLWNCLRYGVSQAVAFALAYLTYPSCLGQMFRGQRGAQATENFFDLSNTLERLNFFYELLDEFVFGKMLPVLLLLLLVLAVTVYRQKGLRRGKEGKVREKDAGKGIDNVNYVILSFAVLGYFLTVSKTALLLGDTSNRYQLPVYGMIVLLLFQALWTIGSICLEGHAALEKVTDKDGAKQSGAVWQTDSRRKKVGKSAYGFAAAVVICLIIDVAGLKAGRVVFLYQEDREQLEYAQEWERENTPVIYLYEPGAEWCIWDVADELFVYSEVYFAAADSVDEIRDDRIKEAESLVVYVANGADSKAQIGRVMDSNGKISETTHVTTEKYCEVYYLTSIP